MELRRWQTNPESLATHGRRARAHRPIRRDEPRFAATRIQIRWLNDLLRVDASHWDGQRSSRDMPATRRAWWRTSCVAQVKAAGEKTEQKATKRTKHNTPLLTIDSILRYFRLFAKAFGFSFC
jgi:hypothetical protein